MQNYIDAKALRTKLGGISRQTLWRFRNHAGYRHLSFPEGLELSPGIVVWPEAEIDKWIASRGRSRSERVNVSDVKAVSEINDAR